MKKFSVLEPTVFIKSEVIVLPYITVPQVCGYAALLAAECYEVESFRKAFVTFSIDHTGA